MSVFVGLTMIIAGTLGLTFRRKIIYRIDPVGCGLYSHTRQNVLAICGLLVTCGAFLLYVR